MDSAPQAALTFLDALTRHDFEGLAATLAPAVRFRAIVPGETATAETAAGTAAHFERWFRDKDDIEIIDRQVEVVVDTVRMAYCARLKKKGKPYLVAQNLCGIVEEGKFATLDLLCTGFRPEPVVDPQNTTHVFDAGDLGCGSGLPREFRTRLGQIPVGHVLEVITDDPSAREDLPSMARLLGHNVRSVEEGPDRKTRIRVERSK